MLCFTFCQVTLFPAVWAHLSQTKFSCRAAAAMAAGPTLSLLLNMQAFFVSLYSKGQVVMTKKFNEKCFQNHINTHTHTHTHTRKSQKESERMVSVQSCGVSHTVWGEHHAFSEGRSGCTNFLQFLGQ
jgi:hypothetical protein